MYKTTVSMLVLITLMCVPLVSADYLVYNGSKTEKAYVVYAYYVPHDGPRESGYSLQVVRDGWRVHGHYIVEPGTFKNLSVPKGTKSVYVRIKRNGVVTPNRPASENTNYGFHVTNKAFTSFERRHEGVAYFSGEGVKESDFVREYGFYKYENGGTFTLGGPLKYGVKTVGLNVSGRRVLGGKAKRWTRRFSAPGKVLYKKATNVVFYGSGKARFDSLTANGNTVTAKGIIEDGLTINSDIRGYIKIYYRK